MSVKFGHLARFLGLTATPASTGAGDAWFRTDTGQVQASDGVAGIPLTVGPTGNLPVVRSTFWHAVPPTGAPATANVPVDRMFALPFWPGQTCTITAMAADVTLALAGGNLRMGVYQSDGVLPTALLADFGTVTAGLTGIRQISGLSTVVRPVLHFLVIGRQGGILNLGLTTRDTWDPIISEAAPTIAGTLNSYFIDGVGGALPGTFGTPAGSATGPALSVQLT